MSAGVRAAQAVRAGGEPAVAAADAAKEVADALSAREGSSGGVPATDLAVVFCGGMWADDAEAIASVVREQLSPGCLVGVTAQGVVAGGREVEHGRALAVWAARLPGARLRPLRFAPDAPPDLGPDDEMAGLLLLADPFSFGAEAFLGMMAEEHPGVPVSGGLASGGRQPGTNRLLLNDGVYADGAVGVRFDGPVRLLTLVSQGCKPVGATYVVTKAERNVLVELGGRLPFERMQETYREAAPGEQALMRTGLHIGRVIDEYREDFGPGDFLVRGVLGADPSTGAVAVGDRVEVGETVQFHVRDADTADEELRRLLEALPGDGQLGGALLFTCNGRGSHLFGGPDHDAGLVRKLLGEVPVAGFFCAGEFGPVGPRSFLHGFTASLLAFVDARGS